LLPSNQAQTVIHLAKKDDPAEGNGEISAPFRTLGRRRELADAGN
jgi:hypothetical protein